MKYSVTNHPIVVNLRRIRGVCGTVFSKMGHLLGLYHVFDGNGSEHNGCPAYDPDFCPDTRYYDRGNYEATLNTVPGSQASRYNRVSCDGTSYQANNFMDYFYCYNNSFTQQQVTRVRHVIDYGLWLPTPSNAQRSGRRGYPGIVKRPPGLRYVQPVICR